MPDPTAGDLPDEPEVIEVSCKWCCRMGPIKSLCANCDSPMLGASSIRIPRRPPSPPARPASFPT